MKNNPQTYFNSILRHFRKRRAINKAAHLGFECLAVNSFYLIFCLILETIWYLSPDLKTLLWLILTLNVFFVYRAIEIVLDLILNKDKQQNEALLLKIGREYEDVNDRLLNHYQLSFLDNDIAAQGVIECMAKYPSGYFQNSYRSIPLRSKWRFALIAFLLLCGFSILASSSFTRFVHRRTAYEPHNDHQIIVSPPDTSIYAYDSLIINVQKKAPSNFPVEIYRISESYNNVAFRSLDSLISYTPGKIASSVSYVIRLRRPNIFFPRKYPDSDTLNINVMKRPKIEAFNIMVNSPEYAGIAPATYQGNLDRISMLTGSEITFNIDLSDDVGRSYALWLDDTLSFRLEGHHASLVWVPKTQGEISLILKNKAGIGTVNIPSYYIELEPDLYPELTVIDPKISDDLILSEQMALPYLVHLRDDFGISSFTVNYRSYSEYSSFNDTAYQTIELPYKSGSRLQTASGVWEIHDFITPGSEITYYFELSDNDIISGPKKVRSALYYAKLPTLGDLFDSQNRSQEETMAMLEDELISTEEIVNDLEEVRQQLLTEGKMDWEDKTALEENLKTLEAVQEELNKMQADLNEQRQFMEENKLFSDKVMQSFEQLQELMNELIDDDMFDMLQNLQEKLERNDTSNMEELLEDFNEKAKRFEESLDRMLEVFKRIQQEQRLEELGQKIKESLKEQQELLNKADERSADELAEQQKKIASDMEKWETLSKESANLFEEQDREHYDEFLQEMEELDIMSTMNEANEQYEQGQKQAGEKSSRDAKDKMNSLESAFSSMSSQMMQQQKDEIKHAFQKAFQLALYLSGEQEKTLEKGRELKNGSPLIHRYTSKMNDHLDIALEINKQLLELSKMTFLVDQGIGLALGQVIGNLRSGIQNVEEAKLSQGQRNFTAAFENMNKLARILLERMNMVMDQQQGNASGMEFYMQQLQQMAGQQQQLNSGMPQLGPNGSPGSSMMDQLAKMAAQQQALRKRLKQIQQGMSESGNDNKMTGNLDRIAKDMGDVIDQMRQNRVDRQTIMRQEKIVQRLLDASRSATSRDYKKERESQTGTDIPREDPFSLPGDLGDHQTLIDMIRRDVQASELSPQEKREMEQYLESLIGKSFEPESK